MLLPKHLPDETLCSLIARIARINGLKDIRVLLPMLLAGRKEKSFIDTLLSLTEFCEGVSYAYGTTIELLREQTWLPELARLGELNSSTLENIAEGRLLLSLGQMSFLGPSVLSCCPRCIESDIADFGVAYWHRVHQPGAVVSCPSHQGVVIKKLNCVGRCCTTSSLCRGIWCQKIGSMAKLV